MVGEENPGEGRGRRRRLLLFDAAHLHAHVARFDHDGHAHGVQRLLDAVADLHRQPLLYLQAAGEALHHTGYFGKPRDMAVGDVGDMRLAVER